MIVYLLPELLFAVGKRGDQFSLNVSLSYVLLPSLGTLRGRAQPPNARKLPSSMPPAVSGMVVMPLCALLLNLLEKLGHVQSRVPSLSASIDEPVKLIKALLVTEEDISSSYHERHLNLPSMEPSTT